MPIIAVVVRVGTGTGPAFQLRKGEEGLSVFDPDMIVPPLSPDEILDAFRPGSVLLYRRQERVVQLGLRVVASEGAGHLPDRLRACHAELRPGSGMSRADFKAALKELENP
jgi:hypothetical protein